jgi:hypothetical protein
MRIKAGTVLHHVAGFHRDEGAQAANVGRVKPD